MIYFIDKSTSRPDYLEIAPECDLTRAVVLCASSAGLDVTTLTGTLALLSDLRESETIGSEQFVSEFCFVISSAIGFMIDIEDVNEEGTV